VVNHQIVIISWKSLWAKSARPKDFHAMSADTAKMNEFQPKINCNCTPWLHYPAEAQNTGY
jgi:hypothetical protein